MPAGRAASVGALISPAARHLSSPAARHLSMSASAPLHTSPPRCCRILRAAGDTRERSVGRLQRLRPARRSMFLRPFHDG